MNLSHKPRETSISSTAEAAISGVHLRLLLRNSHIFSAAIIEGLETRFLSKAIGGELSRCQLRTLRFIAADGELRIGDVARCLGISAAAASKTIGRLEELGLVARHAVPGDRRATLLSVSKAGHRVVDSFDDFAASKVAPLIELLGAPKVVQLSTLLEHASRCFLEQPLEEATGEETCLRCAGFFEESCPLQHQGCAFQSNSQQDDASPRWESR